MKYIAFETGSAKYLKVEEESGFVSSDAGIYKTREELIAVLEGDERYKWLWEKGTIEILRIN